MKKKLFLLTLVIVLAISVFAYADEINEFIVTKAGFGVFVNGKEFKSDKPIVVIDGSTYMPLKAVGDVLGVKVVWNDKLNRVEIGETNKETAATKYSFSNPAPFNTPQTISVKNILQEYTAQMTVKEIIRGDKAWQMIKLANQFNDEPKEGYEYMLANIDFKLMNITEGQSYDLNSAVNIKLVSSQGKVYDYASVVNPDPKLDATLYKGANSEGWAAYLVKRDDPQPKLVFGQDYNGAGGIWFKAY